MASSTRVHPQVEAEEYLEKHKIKRLFQNLGTRLLYERPKDANAFLLETLQQMKSQTPFFNETDVRACFSAFDIHQTGSISKEQYQNAVKSLGIETPSAPLESDTIDRETFVSNLLSELHRDNTFAIS